MNGIPRLPGAVLKSSGKENIYAMELEEPALLKSYNIGLHKMLI